MSEARLTEKYKTASRRFFASLIDGLVFAPCIYLERFFLTPETPLFVAIGGLFLFDLCYLSYTILLHAFYGQTLGKRCLKVVVLDITENPLTYWQAVQRDIFTVFFSALFLGAEIEQILRVGTGDDLRSNTIYEVVLISYFVLTTADCLVALSDGKRRAIHDFIAGTVVVKKS